MGEITNLFSISELPREPRATSAKGYKFSKDIKAEAQAL